MRENRSMSDLQPPASDRAPIARDAPARASVSTSATRMPPPPLSSVAAAAPSQDSDTVAPGPDTGPGTQTGATRPSRAPGDWEPARVPRPRPAGRRLRPATEALTRHTAPSRQSHGSTPSRVQVGPARPRSELAGWPRPSTPVAPRIRVLPVARKNLRPPPPPPPRCQEVGPHRLGHLNALRAAGHRDRGRHVTIDGA